MPDGGVGSDEALYRGDAQPDADRQQQHVPQPDQRMHVQPVGVGLAQAWTKRQETTISGIPEVLQSPYRRSMQKLAQVRSSITTR